MCRRASEDDLSIPALLLFAGMTAAQPPAAMTRAAVLAAAAESLLVVAAQPRPADGVLLAADSATARALAAPARRAGLVVRVASEPAYCAAAEARGTAARTIGPAIRLALDSLSTERAVVRWAVTCLLSSPYPPTPFSGGEGGTYEVVRRGRVWTVARSRGAFAM